MSERELIEYIGNLARGDGPPWLSVGIGDDAAELIVPGSGRLVLTTDMLIQGVHCETGTPPVQAGRKAVARAHSDIAAMAARPLCTVAAAGLPTGWDEQACRELCCALHEAAEELSAPLVGGDVSSTDGPLVIAVTAVGTPGPKGVIARRGARPGDALAVTGRLGGSILGRHLEFRPRIREALLLAERADVHAMIDVSDGLSTDALHLAEAGGLSVVLHAECVPVSQDAVTLAGRTGRTPLWHALNDGEDYELLFCALPEQVEELAEAGLDGTPVTLVGEIAGRGQSWLSMPDGRREPLQPGGWEHLRQ